VPRIVLVADDSPTIQKRALGILKGEGFEVETVSNGVAAIRRLAVLHPAVILADVSMPGRDGYEVCEFVKKSAEHSHVPVLLVASDMEPYDEARGAEVKADGIIKKPFEAQDLIAIVAKFAEQFETATPTLAAPAVSPAAREATKEFAFSLEDTDEAPTVVQHVTPIFSAAPEGVPFVAPAVEESSAYYPESQPAETEVSQPAPQAEAEVVLDHTPAPEFVDTIPAPEPESAPTAETPMVEEEPPAPSPLAPPPPPPPVQAPTFLEGLEAATPEPVFIDEQPAPTSEPPAPDDEVHTMIFRTPLEIAEPVWTDETIAAPPPEPAGPAALEPQLEAEAPAPTTEIPVEQIPEPPSIAHSVAATSLDSFSLEDATAGQVYFAPEAGELAPEEVASEQTLPVEVAPEEIRPAEAAPVDVATVEVAPEGAASEQTLPVEVAPEEIRPAEAAPVDVAHAEVAPEEVASEQTLAVEVASEEVPPAEAASVEVAPEEEAPAKVTPAEAVPAEVASSALAEEAPATEIAPPEPAPEAASAEIASPAPAPEAPPELSAEVAAPPPSFDWGLFYSVVQKVVLRMAPPALPVEAVEELTRRLAEEIATEIVTESSQPPA
jgi:CheY-like chemotaxis protein